MGATRTICEYEIGLAYRHGKFVKTLEAGKYRFWQSGWRISVVDMRLQGSVVPGQEILTKDLLPIKISLISYYKVTNAKQYSESSNYPDGAIHLILQVAMRTVAAQMTFDECLEQPIKLASEVQAQVAKPFAELGIVCNELAVRDIMVPPQLRKANLAVLVAQKEALASVEKARGEAASLRCLLNASNLIKDHPEVLQLRMLQALENGKAGSAIIDFTRKN